MYEPIYKTPYASFGYKGFHDGAGWWINGKRYTGDEPFSGYATPSSGRTEILGAAIVILAAGAVLYGGYRLALWGWRAVAGASE